MILFYENPLEKVSFYNFWKKSSANYRGLEDIRLLEQFFPHFRCVNSPPPVLSLAFYMPLHYNLHSTLHASLFSSAFHFSFWVYWENFILSYSNTVRLSFYGGSNLMAVLFGLFSSSCRSHSTAVIIQERFFFAYKRYPK